MKRDFRNRFVPEHVAEGQTAQEALAVADASRAGVVAGVAVDFRHPDLPPGEWIARAWWDVAHDSEAHAGFIFEEEAVACERELAAMPESGAQDLMDRRALIMRKLALPHVKPGDRISVESVVPRIVGGPFHHPHDMTVRLANLVCTKPSGETIRPASPLTFYGITQLRTGPERDAYDRLADRILLAVGGLDPRKYEVTRKYREDAAGRWQDAPLDVRAAHAIEQADNAITDLVAILGTLEDEGRAGALLRCAVNEAALAGFLQAKHESTRAEQWAGKQKPRLDQGRLANKDYDNRRALALQIWADKPKAAINEVSKIVAQKLGKEKSSVMNSLWEIVPETSRSFRRAQERRDKEKRDKG